MFIKSIDPKAFLGVRQANEKIEEQLRKE